MGVLRKPNTPMLPSSLDFPMLTANENLYIFFNWNIIALARCVSFCYTTK